MIPPQGQLEEEEKSVLLSQLKGLTVEEGKRQFGISEVYPIRFYQGDKEIERYTISNLFYITTGHSMRYKVIPIAVELNGTKIEDTTYITGFLLRFTEKMLVKTARTEMLEKLSAIEGVDDLKTLLAYEEYYDGADDLGNGYRFMMSELGFKDYWNNLDDTLENGNLRICFNDGVLEAALEITYLTKDGKTETYAKIW